MKRKKSRKMKTKKPKLNQQSQITKKRLPKPERTTKLLELKDKSLRKEFLNSKRESTRSNSESLSHRRRKSEDSRET